EHEQKRQKVIMTPLERKPQEATQYSDIGMMLLGIILERIADRPLNQLFKEEVAIPLGMTETCFKPTPEQYKRCVPTELHISDQQPPVPWQGIVHDENARWLGGVAGHAGLFSTAGDLTKFAEMMLHHGNGFIQEDILSLFTRRANLTPDSSRCLGWDSPTQPGSSGGRLIGPNAFVHTGFTGTSFWIDPDTGIAVILLTNAVHPFRENKKNYFPWRNDVHTLTTQLLL
ncbi:MAG: serine hydrolase, partial [Victivallales bacterium]|nr:serine hydrolase [Victivallales bacterium]